MDVNWRHTAPGSDNGFLLMSQQATWGSCRCPSSVSQVPWVTEQAQVDATHAVGLRHNEKHLAKRMKSHLCHGGRYWSSPKAVLCQRDPDKQFGQRQTAVQIRELHVPQGDNPGNHHVSVTFRSWQKCSFWKPDYGLICCKSCYKMVAFLDVW